MDKKEKTVLRVNKLCKNTILKNISFSMLQGEMTAIMGPSGSGKSTLLYNVSGMDKPSSGEVWIDQTKLTDLSEDESANYRLNNIGFVFQQMNMLGNLNILDNILLPARQKNKQTKKSKLQELDNIHARELMKKMSISELADRKITEVSGGQLQRACICRSMINCPKLLFADEPTGALNQSAAAEVMQTFVKLNREGTTILMVTHDSKIASLCQRILYLIDGQIAGELQLGKTEHGSEKSREEQLASWLAKLSW